MDNTYNIITIRNAEGEKAVFKVGQNGDIWEYKEVFKRLLQFLTFHNDTIDELLGKEEE